MSGFAVAALFESHRQNVKQAIVRGFRCRCPQCGQGKLFRSYLKVSDQCGACGEDLSHQRADDAPPYVTMMIVGHLLVAAMAAADDLWAWPLWVHATVWCPLTVILSLLLLPRIKGAIIGIQWANRMHGFAEA